MNTLRISPMLAKLLDSPAQRAIFEREHTINCFLLGIEKAMADQKMTKTSLAGKMGKKTQAISRAMQGKQNLTIGTMVDLAVALGKTVEIKVVDLPKVQVVTESKASASRRSQVWTAGYLNRIVDPEPSKKV
jgi:plasmid maintenance system antidote protein VapI